MVSPADMLVLQRLMGNKAVAGLVVQRQPDVIGAMRDLSSRGIQQDQSAPWNSARAQMIGAGLKEVPVAAENFPLETGRSLIAEYVELKGESGERLVDPGEFEIILGQARAAVRDVVEAVAGVNLPSTITFYLCPRRSGVPQQQAFSAAGTYRVVLLVKPAKDVFARGIEEAMQGESGASVAGQIAGEASKRERQDVFAKGTVIHEIGHLAHAVGDQSVFMWATAPRGLPADLGTDDPEEKARIEAEFNLVKDENSAVMAALARVIGADVSSAKMWSYALNRQNPAEVVAEAFAAMAQGRPIPKPIAAVYVAYRGPRGGRIDQALADAFGGAIPEISRPRDAIPYFSFSRLPLGAPPAAAS